MNVKLWMVFEAVAATEDAVEGSLEDHLEKLDNEPEAEIIESNIDAVEKVEKPHPDIDEGFSQVAETVVEASSFEEAVALTVNYGPTYIQMEEPDVYDLSLKEGQEALQNVADIMRRYAEMGAGGMLISKTEER
ncbi:hypothetical protein GLU60_03615 [Nanohaloarchaea archaeon H01]|jgi:hypothetical protein|nr:hypothetical protein [Nanohaloarchaea archaeon H01]